MLNWPEQTRSLPGEGPPPAGFLDGTRACTERAAETGVQAGSCEPRAWLVECLRGESCRHWGLRCGAASLPLESSRAGGVEPTGVGQSQVGGQWGLLQSPRQEGTANEHGGKVRGQELSQRNEGERRIALQGFGLRSRVDSRARSETRQVTTRGVHAVSTEVPGARRDVSV